ncbi:MAG: alpha-D-ribose 1-methylphosphonate 5-triphosphate diphosphatase [Alphaproteobacteria bacterium]|nr:alpha-D-ribose 1-methylphosphonate 5-triphosphate diphosphatase [Alphaproteobacteria bacterium]
MVIRIESDRILQGNKLVVGAVHIDNDKIVETRDAPGTIIDARGLLVLPGIVDVHGDAFERQIQPRPKVTFPLDIALMETDRQMVANGITTAYHGLSVSWEPGLRSLETARLFVDALRALRPSLACDTKLHIRWETFALEAVDEIIGWIAEEDAAIFAVNDHTTDLLTGTMRAVKIDEMAARMGLESKAFSALIERLRAREAEVPAAIADAATRARQAGARILGHDEATPAQRARFRDLGSTVSEFPMSEETARAARGAGEHTVLGAPNVVRGGSHNGALDATAAVRDGLCSILASDYYYPAPLHAAFKLAQEHGVGLPEAWALISRNPAEALGLADRGTLAAGKRADVILVDDGLPATPRVVASFIAGEQVLGHGRKA